MRKNKKISLLIVMFCSYCLLLTAIAPVALAEKDSFNTEEIRKNENLRTYPPDLSEMQEFGFGTFKTKSGEVVESKVRPDAHFRLDDGSEYLVFYDQHIGAAKKALTDTLQGLYSEYPTTFYTGQNYYNAIAEDKGTLDVLVNYFDYIPTSVIVDLNRLFGVINDGSKDVVQANSRATLLAERSGELTRAHKDCIGRRCIAILSKDLSQPLSYFPLTDSPLEEIEKRFSCAMSLDISDKEAVEKINEILDKATADIQPRAGLMQEVFFMYPLNRASYYLSNLEKGLQNKDLETLEAMKALRNKIDRLTLEHRFIFEQNKAPILGITIDRCKIIVEDEQRTMIFLDQQETKKFIKTVEKMLDSKASVISDKYPFEGFTGPQLRELAESLKPESFQDVLDKMEKDIHEDENMLAKKGVSIFRTASRAAIDFFLDDDIVRFSKSDSKDKAVGFSEDEVKEYLQSMKVQQADSDIKQPLSIAINELNLSPFEKSNLIRGFEQFLEYRNMQSDLSTKKAKHDFLRKAKNTHEDFINLFKLYIAIARGDYGKRDDFWGVTIEEAKGGFESVNDRIRLFREYFIKEIQRLD